MKEISEALGSALIAYLEGEATLLQIESLHEWAGLDPENAELLYGLKHLYAERNATSKIEAVDVETMRHRLLARPEFASEERIAALRPAPRRKLWRKIWFRAVGYAASAAALIAVGVLVGKSGGTVFSDSFNTICVDAGSKSRIVLADGTQVTMKASSKLRYPASFGSGPREVWLDGEAYFDVTHDAQHPFIVTTPAFRVRVLGTVFNVRSFSGESVAEATLAEGSVALQHSGGRNLICLHPGQQAVYDADAEQLEVNEVPVGDLLLIRYGVITLDNATLPEIIGRIEQAYGVELRPEGQQMPDDHYNFNFQKDASVEDVVDLLQFVSGCRFKIIQLNR